MIKIESKSDDKKLNLEIIMWSLRDLLKFTLLSLEKVRFGMHCMK